MRGFTYVLIPALVLAACGPGQVAATPESPVDTSGPLSSPSPAAEDVTPEATNVRVEDEREFSFRPLLAFDAIRPVYDPEFVTAEESPLLDEELVIGVSLEGEAKAYPITVLIFREIVNDELARTPILVTW